MPTKLKRTNVTHTPHVQQALTVAAAEWPDDASSDSALLTHLAIKGADDLQSEREARQARAAQDARARRAVLAQAAEQIDAAYGHLYTDDYLDEVRAGWTV